MSEEVPTEEERARFRQMAKEMVAARLQMFAENAPRYAEALGTLRSALVKSGFSPEESMQIVLKVAEHPMGGPGRFRHHRHKH